jgi:indole-3-glycerol phosphate synthase
MTTKTVETGTYLDRILVQTAKDLDVRKARMPVEELRARFASLPDPVNVPDALRRDTVTVIAEIKRASPSKGLFPTMVVPAEVAASYIEGGVAAISCLTDEPFFRGSLCDLADVSSVASMHQPPVGVLRKDFTIDTYQIDEARAFGASFVLLIVAALDDVQLREFREHAEELGMSALVEVHDAGEAERAIASGATLIGINNRNLRTLDVNLATTETLAPTLPEGTTIVGESGIFTANDVARLANAGVHAVLVGESLIVQDDRATAVRAIAGVPRVP